MDCYKQTEKKSQIEDNIGSMIPTIQKVHAMVGIFNTMHSNDPSYHGSITSRIGLEGAKQSMDSMLSYLTNGMFKNVNEYAVLKDLEKKNGETYTRGADLLINHGFDTLISDLNTYRRPDWFDVQMDKSLKGYIRGVTSGDAGERISNTANSFMLLQSDVAVLWRQCPVVNNIRQKWHSMVDYILGRTDEFNIRYNDLIQFTVDNFGKEGVAIADKYMKYMDATNSNYKNGEANLEQLQLLLNQETGKNGLINQKNKKLKTPMDAMKALVEIRNKFWSEFNYGSPDNPNTNHFAESGSVANATGSFALYHKEVGTRMADQLLDALDLYGFKVTDLSDTHWSILSRFADEKRVKPFLDEYNAIRIQSRKKPISLDPYELRKGYIPTKNGVDDKDAFAGTFKDYANIKSFQRGHEADGDFFSGLKERIQQLKFSPSALAEELTFKMMDNVVNSNKTKVHSDYLLWRSQNSSIGNKLEKHIEKVYHILAYHKDSITDKAMSAIEQYKEIGTNLLRKLAVVSGNVPEKYRSRVDSTFERIIGELGQLGGWKNAKNIEKTVKKATQLIDQLEKAYQFAIDNSNHVYDKDFLEGMSDSFSDLKAIDTKATDFDYHSLAVTIDRLENVKKVFSDTIQDPEARQDMVMGMNTVIRDIGRIKNRIDNATSVNDRKQIYAEARTEIQDTLGYIYGLDAKYGNLVDRYEGEMRRYLRRAEYSLVQMRKIARRPKGSTEYIKHSTLNPTTWISSQSMTYYTSIMMTCMLKNSAISNLVGATSSALSLSEGGKQLALMNQYRKNRKSGAIIDKAVTKEVELNAARIMGAIKETEVFDPATRTKNTSKMTTEYYSGAFSNAIETVVRNNMESGPLAAGRTIANIFGRDPNVFQCKGWTGLFTMAGSEKSLFVRGFAKSLLDDAVRAKIELMEATTGVAVREDDVSTIVSEVMGTHGEAIRKYMDYTRGRFTKDNKSPWGWGMADMARTRPEVFKAMLMTTMLAFKQPMAYASNALAKSTFRLLSDPTGLFKDGVPVAGPLIGVAFLGLKYFFSQDDDKEEDGWWESMIKAPLYSGAIKGLLPTDSFESDLAIMRLVTAGVLGVGIKYEDYTRATNTLGRMSGPAWNGLWTMVLDDLMSDAIKKDVDNDFFVDMTSSQYASMVKKRVGLLTTNPEEQNLMERYLIHVDNIGRMMKRDIGQLVDVPMYMADAVVGFNGRPYGEYADREAGMKDGLSNNIPFIGSIVGMTNDHVSGIYRMLSYFDLIMSDTSDEYGNESLYSEQYKGKRLGRKYKELILAPLGLNGFQPLASDVDESDYQVSSVVEAIRNSEQLDVGQQTNYSKDFLDYVDKLNYVNTLNRRRKQFEEIK